MEVIRGAEPPAIPPLWPCAIRKGCMGAGRQPGRAGIKGSGHPKGAGGMQDVQRPWAGWRLQGRRQSCWPEFTGEVMRERKIHRSNVVSMLRAS